LKTNSTSTKLFSLIAFIFIQQFCYPISKKNQVKDSVAIYITNNDYLKALNCAKKQSNLFLKNKKYLEFSKVIIQKADIYNSLNDHEKALKVLFNALKIIANKNEKIGEVIIFRKIGSINSRLKDYEAAKKYFCTALSKAKKAKNDSLIGGMYQPMYKIHITTNSDSTLYYLKKTMEYNKKIGTNESLTTAYNNYFFYYKTLENYPLAKTYLDSTLYFSKKTKSKAKITLALTNLGYYQAFVEEDNQKAKETYLKIFELNPNDTLSASAADLYFGYADILIKLKEHNLANSYLIKCSRIRDKIYSEKSRNDIRDLEIKYQIDKVEYQYKEQQLLLENKQSKNKKILFILVASLVLCVILFYFFYQNTKLKQKNKLKNIESQIQQNIINATIDGQENERKKIAAVLHDNISASLSSAGLQLSAFVVKNQSSPEEITKTRTILKEAHDKVRDLSHELLPTLLAQFGLFYALEDLCEKNSNSLIQFEYISNVSQKTRFNEDYEMKIYFIITELLNNILKHSQATKSTVSLEVVSNQLIISIEDNGKGFDAKSQSQDGFGLTQIRARISNMKGILNISSKLDAGTTINIKVPVLE
jgi:signal transduction histidine kinase